MTNKESARPALVQMELQPIPLLLTQQFMSINRVKSVDEKPIETTSILHWFLRRYKTICSTLHRHQGNMAMFGKDSDIDVDKSATPMCRLDNRCSWNNKCRHGVEACQERQSVKNKNHIEQHCEWVGCPHPGEGYRDKVCETSGTMCVEHRHDPAGYICYTACNASVTEQHENTCTDTKLSTNKRQSMSSTLPPHPSPSLEEGMVCVPDDEEPAGYFCLAKGCPKHANVCHKGRRCVSDNTRMVGYRCVEACSPTTCRVHVETCRPTETAIGFVCQYIGCPKYKSICPQNMICKDDPMSMTGYQCVDPCLDNNCPTSSQECRPVQHAARGYVCEYTGCPTDRQVCPLGFKCIPEESEGRMGACVEACYKNNCPDGMVCVAPSLNQSRYYDCSEYIFKSTR